MSRKERYRSVFMVFFGILAGDSGVLYSVVGGEKPVYMLALAVIGTVVAFVVYVNLNAIRGEIEEKLDELETL